MIKNSLVTVVLTWILVITTVAIVKFDAKLFTVIFFIDVWLFSQPHVISTFFKQATYNRFSKKSLILWYVLLIVALFVIFKLNLTNTLSVVIVMS